MVVSIIHTKCDETKNNLFVLILIEEVPISGILFFICRFIFMCTHQDFYPLSLPPPPKVNSSPLNSNFHVITQ